MCMISLQMRTDYGCLNLKISLFNSLSGHLPSLVISGMCLNENIQLYQVLMLKHHTLQLFGHLHHEKSGFVRVILKANFKPTYRPNPSLFWSGNSDLLYSFFFYFLQNLSNPLLFTHCCCYSKELTCLNWDLKQKSQLKYVNPNAIYSESIKPLSVLHSFSIAFYTLLLLFQRVEIFRFSI